MNMFQIALISWASGLWLGHISTLLFDRYRKGGERDLMRFNTSVLIENELLKEKLLVAGGRKGDGGESGHVDTPSSSSFEWVCAKRGHLYSRLVNGPVLGNRMICSYCGFISDGAA